MQYCPHCMKPAAGGKCPNCGGDTNWTGQKGIDLPVGTVLNGGNGLRTYQIGAARGKGGFGITYVALETNSNRRVAVKEYFPTRCAFRNGNGVDVQMMTGQEDVFQSGMNSFLDEGKMLLSQDDLSCVVHVIDYFKANGTAYLVMEYLDGVALHAQMTRMGGRIPVSELMPRLAPLMRDIGQLHRRGVIHRDISPDNIMWMPDGTLKLMDFGSARSMENGKSMTVLMKHGFSPIEQYRSRGQGPYTDVYALAATIYYCVTGVIPPAAVERLDEDGLQSPVALGAALTVNQETALLWALSIQPNARPQSMEEFASRLYKEGPSRPQAPIQTGAGAFSTAEQPPQAQPATERSAAYPYDHSGPTTGQYNYSGQPAGPAAGQYNYNGPTAGPTTGQYNYGGQPAGQYSYNGQPAGQYSGPYNGQSPQGQAGRKKNTPVIIGAAAAVVAVVTIVIAAVNGGGTADSPTPSGLPSRGVTSEEPAFSAAPTPEPVAGVTDDGFCYEIIGGDHAVLTGYEGNGTAGYMPDYVEDDIPITEIADNAFAGAPVGRSAFLPIWLETIGANAFRGCSDLTYICAYSDVDTETSSFSGCDELWFVIVYDQGISGWKLPSGVHLFYKGMETGAGLLKDADFYNGMLAGETDDGEYVLLDVPPGTTYVEDLDGAVWVSAWAVDNLTYGAEVELGKETLFPYEAYGLAAWTAPEGSLADMWLLSCEAADAINGARSAGAPRIEPDLDLVRASTVRAKEYAELYDGDTRPDGSGHYTVLEDFNISYDFGWGGYGSKDKLDMSAALDNMRDWFAPALTRSDSAEFAGEYMTRIGMAYYHDTREDQYYWQGFVIIP